MNNVNIIGLTLHSMDNGCSQVEKVLENESSEMAEEYIDSPVLEIGQSEKLTTKLTLLSEIYDNVKEAQEIIQRCRTLLQVYTGITVTSESPRQSVLLLD